MGNAISCPVIAKKTEQGTGKDYKWAVTTMQGWRDSMEDTHLIKTEMWEELKTFSWFTVFDGHSGIGLAQSAADHILGYLKMEAPFDTLKDGQDYDIEQIKDAIQRCFLKFDQQRSFNLSSFNKELSGCTCTGIMLTPKHIFFYNLGDSRTMLVANDAELRFVTKDHKPTNEEEKQRIEKAGGFVENGRVNKSLAVSRALGDYEMKGNSELPQDQQLVSPRPDVTCIDRKGDESYILIACDGIYDVAKNEYIIELVKLRMKMNTDLGGMTHDIVNFCLSKASKDNMSAIMMMFDSSDLHLASQETEEMKEDEKLNNKLRKLVEDHVLENNKEGDMSNLFFENMINKLVQDHADVFDELPKKEDMPPGIMPFALRKGLMYDHFYKVTEPIRDRVNAQRS